ncbi:MAG: hypothetical protein KDD61_03720 [Bdellovibrionales bacterium]|nr:hypothetical protein [Bdellovibrionales bacterium]
MEKNTENLLKLAKKFTPQPDVYMSTRVLAQVREKRLRKRQWGFALLSSVVGSLLTAIVFLSIQNLPTKAVHFAALVDKPYVVRMEMDQLNNQNIFEAEIVLAQGLLFHSDEFSDLQEKQSLVFAWPKDFEGDVFPFVIKGTQEGIKPVKVRFFDEAGEVLEEREIKIRFEKSVSEMRQPVKARTS